MTIQFPLPALVLLLLPGVLGAQAGGQSKETKEEFIKAAEAGAPDRISAQAAIVRMEPNGKTSQVRSGSNGFTCTLLPDQINTPLCADQKGLAWFTAAMSGQPKPPSTGGVGYMAKGSGTTRCRTVASS